MEEETQKLMVLVVHMRKKYLRNAIWSSSEKNIALSYWEEREKE